MFMDPANDIKIPGTAYTIQLGLVNGKWTSRLLKGNEIIESYVYKDEDLSVDGFTNQNLIVGWILRTVGIPNINPHQIMKLVQAKRGYFTYFHKADGEDRVPYPYIFKPPEPPDDIGVAMNMQLNKPIEKEEPKIELFCRYCGSKLGMDESFCSVCGKKS